MTGDDSDLCWSAHVSRCATGRRSRMCTGLKLRQYPRRFGSTSFAESRWEPGIARGDDRHPSHGGPPRAGLRRVQARRPRRPLQAHRGDGGAHVVPPRSRDARGIQPAAHHVPRRPRPARRGAAPVHRGPQVDPRGARPPTVVLHFLPKGDLTVWSWLKSYRGRRVYAYASWDDPRPFVATVKGILATAWRQRPFGV